MGAGSGSIPRPLTGFIGDTGVGRIRLALSSCAPLLLRTHAMRNAVRVATLIVSDLAVLRLVWLLGTMRSTPEFVALHDLTFFQLAVAIGLGLLATGCYGAGDQRRDSSALAGGTALGVTLAMWGVVWNGEVGQALGASILLWLVATLPLIITRRLIDRLVQLARPSGANVVRALVIGPSERAEGVIDHPVLGESHWCHLVAFLDPEGQSVEETTSRLAYLIRLRRIDTVIAAGPLSDGVYAAVLDAATTSGCQVYSVPRVSPSTTMVPRIVWRSGHPVVELTHPALIGSQMIVKRLFDVLLSSVVLLALAPLFIIIAILVHFDSPGPVFFRQQRIGQGGRRFTILKFRTMHDKSDALREELLESSMYRDGRLFKIANDPRITRLGAWLRRTSLDELPQFWNVLIGDMSLVGPRPPMPSEVAQYESQHYARFDVKPGITGPWQVGGRNEIQDFEDVVRLETAYIRRWTLWLDLELLLRTVPVVLSGRGAH